MSYTREMGSECLILYKLVAHTNLLYMKHTLLALLLYVAGTALLGQPSTPTLLEYHTREAPINHWFLSAPEYQTHLLLVQGSKFSLWGHLVDEQSGVSEAELLLPEKALLSKRLYYQNIVGYSYTDANTFQLYMHLAGKRQLLRYHVQMDPDSATLTEEVVYSIGKRERFLGGISKGDEFIFTTIELFSSHLHIYRVPAEGEVIHLDWDLKDEGVGIRRNQTLYELLEPNGDSDKGPPFKALGLASPARSHLYGPALSFDNKLYRNGEHVYLTLDGESAYTLLIDMPLSGAPANVSKLDATYDPCENAGYPRKASSFVYKDQLWQPKGCEKGLSLNIYDIPSASRVYKEILEEEALTAWAEETQSLGKAKGILAHLLAQPLKGPKFDGHKLPLFLKQYGPNISVTSRARDSIEIQLVAYGEKRGLMALTALGATALMVGSLGTAGVAVSAPLNGLYGSRLIYLAPCNPETFEPSFASPHLPFHMPPEALATLEEEQKGQSLLRYKLNTFYLGLKGRGLGLKANHGYLIYTYPVTLER